MVGSSEVFDVGNMSKADVIYYLSMMIAFALAYAGLQAAGVESHLVRLLIGMAVGVGVGRLTEDRFTRRK
jgi:hypothetical protein